MGYEEEEEGEAAGCSHLEERKEEGLGTVPVEERGGGGGGEPGASA